MRTSIKEKSRDIKFSILITLAVATVFGLLDLGSGYYSGLYKISINIEVNILNWIRVIVSYFIPSILGLAITFVRDSIIDEKISILKASRWKWFFVYTIFYAFFTFVYYIKCDKYMTILLLTWSLIYIVGTYNRYINLDILFNTVDDLGTPVGKER